MKDQSALRDCPPDSLVDARNMAHKAVQPVTKAARVNIPAVEDASHTNLRWDRNSGALLTNPLGTSGGDVNIGLIVSDLRLIITQSGQRRAQLDLSGITTGDAESWLDSQLTELRLEPTSPVSHPYELPPAVEEIATYSTSGRLNELAGLAAWFALADTVLRQFAGAHAGIRPGPSPVRCWPHHFDIATYVGLEAGDPESAIGIGVGLSPGDESYAEPYFYVNPWPHPDPGDLPDPPALGHWHTQGFVGAVLTGTELLAAPDQMKGAADFIEEAFAIGRGRLGM